MKVIQEFRQFAMRGNVVDLAVGVIIGSAFGSIVSSFVADILMPPLGVLMGGTDFSGFIWVIKGAIIDQGRVIKPSVTINYGHFIQVTVNFLIVAFSVFLLIRVMNTLNQKLTQDKKAEVVPEVPADVQLLSEIRDLLKRGDLR